MSKEKQEKIRLTKLLVRSLEQAIPTSKNLSLTAEQQRFLNRERALRFLTCLEIRYLLYSYMYMLERCNLKLENIRIGLIGCGAMGRLILNILIIMGKEGIPIKNITVSTRQPEHLGQLSEQYGFKATYDNQQVAEESDILFVATPATLDNWIIADLKEPYSIRCQKPPLRPLVYITTSNINQQKSQGFFGTNHCLQPFSVKDCLKQKYPAVSQFLSKHETYFSDTKEECLVNLENFALDQIKQNISKIYNCFSYVFLGWDTKVETEEQIDIATHEHLHNCFKKPSFQQCYRQRCKRWHSALMNFT